jgi:hypothetical protein
MCGDGTAEEPPGPSLLLAATFSERRSHCSLRMSPATTPKPRNNPVSLVKTPELAKCSVTPRQNPSAGTRRRSARSRRSRSCQITPRSTPATGARRPHMVVPSCSSGSPCPAQFTERMTRTRTKNKDRRRRSMRPVWAGFPPPSAPWFMGAKVREGRPHIGRSGKQSASRRPCRGGRTYPSGPADRGKTGLSVVAGAGRRPPSGLTGR